MREELLQAARSTVQDNLRLQPHERTLIVTDPPRENVGRALWEAAREVARDCYLLEMPEGRRDGEEPPAPVARMMSEAAVILAATTYSLTHTEAARAALKVGARVASLPGIHETTAVRCLSADMEAIAERSLRVAARLTAANEVHVRSALGTDLHLSVAGIEALADTGRIDRPGVLGNLPSGEACLRPAPGSARGRLVIDGSVAGIGDLTGTEPIALVIEAGRVVRVEGEDTAEALDTLLADVGPDAYHVAEFGVGTNHAALVVGSVLEDEKAMGTVHLALGNDLSLGGSCRAPIHIDGIVKGTTVLLDGVPLLEEGHLLDE